MFVSWLATYQWKRTIKNCNSVDAGADNVEKVVYKLAQTLTQIFWMFVNTEKGKLYILKIFGLSTF